MYSFQLYEVDLHLDELREMVVQKCRFVQLYHLGNNSSQQICFLMVCVTVNAAVMSVCPHVFFSSFP